VGICCANHATPLYPQELAVTSPTSGGCSVSIVRMRTKATEFSFSLMQEYNREVGNCGRVYTSKRGHSLSLWDRVPTDVSLYMP
jgi:hypothetical protein